MTMVLVVSCMWFGVQICLGLARIRLDSSQLVSATAGFEDERGCADSGVVVGLAGCQWVNGFKMALAFCFCSAARYVVSRLSELAMSESE